MLTQRFKGDRNYLLRNAQEERKQKLLAYLCSQLRKGYTEQFNPLGLQDNVSIKIATTQPAVSTLDALYDTIATIYRYTNSDNQLPLLFCGTSHAELYGQQWKTWFISEAQLLCRQPAFIKLGLGLVFLNPSVINNLSELRIRQYVQEVYGHKVHKRWGLRLAV